MKTIMPSAMRVNSTLPGRVRVYFLSSFSAKRNKKNLCALCVLIEAGGKYAIAFENT